MLLYRFKVEFGSYLSNIMLSVDAFRPNPRVIC